MRIKNWFNIYVTARIYLYSVIIFFLFRVVLLLTQTARVSFPAENTDVLFAFWTGLRFDLVITGYIMFVPYTLLTILFLFNSKNSLLSGLAFYLVFVVFMLAFFVSAADIPFFKQFFTRFSVMAFQWFDNPDLVISMILHEPRYWLFSVPFILVSIAFFLLIRRVWRSIKDAEITRGRYIVKFLFSVLFAGLMFIGIRGRVDEKSPIKVGTAYFCNNAFLNQLGLNPNFTFIRSYLDSKDEKNSNIYLMDGQEAVLNAREYFNIKDSFPGFPLLRKVEFGDEKPVKHNVVIIIMESMGAFKMKRHGNTKNRTPFLDSISNKGLYFENIYTAGIHTYNGLFSTLFSFPAIFMQNPMKESNMLKYNGIPSTLKKAGYSGVFFVPHDAQFDNMKGFLLANDFEKIVSKPDYPSQMIKSTLGVPDDYMFEFSIPVLNKLHAGNKPFLAVLLTSADHGPYFIPEYFTPRSKKIKEQIVEYADWSLQKFITLASAQPWFENTIFVFVADHGEPEDGTYDLSITYNHTPLVFFNPVIFTEPKVYTCMGGQADIFPTIMGMLRLPYINNTLGLDLLRETRPYTLFNADDKYGIIDDQWLLIARKDMRFTLHKYRSADKKDYSVEFPDIFRQMKKYGESNLQAFQYVVTHKMQYAE